MAIHIYPEKPGKFSKLQPPKAILVSAEGSLSNQTCPPIRGPGRSRQLCSQCKRHWLRIHSVMRRKVNDLLVRDVITYPSRRSIEDEFRSRTDEKWRKIIILKWE